MTEAWEWLRSTPLLGVFLTLLGYRIGCEVRDRTGAHPLAQPVLVAIVVVGTALWALDLSYEEYLVGGSLIAFLLGPATVALAVPLHREAHHLRELAVPMLVAIPVGAVVSIVTAVLTVRALGGGEALELVIAPKAATTPVAIAIADQLGANVSLVAVLTVTAGVLGAVAGPAVLSFARVRDHRARGLAIGSVSHGVGTARVQHDHTTEGAFSGLAMGLTALATSLLVPAVLAIL